MDDYEKQQTWILHCDGASCHLSRETQAALQALGIRTVVHPPYSPDMAPCDFFLLPFLKYEMRGIKFDTPEVLQTFLVEKLIAMGDITIERVFRSWITRLEFVIDSNGEYSSSLKTLYNMLF